MEATSSGSTSWAMPETTGLVSKIKVDEAKFNQLDCRIVGDEKLMGFSLKLNDGSKRKVKQNYFRGLVYRYDSRPLVEIKEAGGFYPRIPRDKNHRVLVSEVIEYTGLFDLNPVVSNQTTGIVATSQSVSWNNGFLSQDLKKYQYMIDTKMDNIRGLDPDYFRAGEAPCYEVCFEDPLPYNSIVGYFENQNHEVFYLNNEYQGSFSWNAEDLVRHYKSLPVQIYSSLKRRINKSCCTVQ
ncbi:MULTISPECIES: hypothetical protein [unclassified Endozoicomonas]|uniref:hypothetical protein n=1 Tax=unclassified Endozoicomonas TaxID=2644528 RepID=UPI002148F1BF|nr:MULTISPECIES: hypothetical protein [unclassified Endozoicomonas]